MLSKREYPLRKRGEKNEGELTEGKQLAIPTVYVGKQCNEERAAKKQQA